MQRWKCFMDREQLGEKLIYGSSYLLDIVGEALQDLFRDASLHYETLRQYG